MSEPGRRPEEAADHRKGQPAVPAALIHGREERWLAGLLLLLALGYLLQMVSPLRLNTDSYRLLSMAVSAYNGQGYLVDGHPDQFSLAYPSVVRTLLQVGVASSMVLVLLNLICLLAGIAVLYAWCRTRSGSVRSVLPVAFVLLSWVTVKHVTIPLTDFLYLAASLLSLFFVTVFWRQRGRRKSWALATAVLPGYVALHCRSIGLALWPAAALAVILHPDHAPLVARLTRQRRNVAALLGALVILLGMAWLLARQTSWYQLQFTRAGSYGHSLLASYGKDPLAFWVQNLRYRLLEFGNVFSNVPGSRVPQLLPVQYLVGWVSWAVVLYGAWLLLREKSRLPLPLYFLSYAALLFMWPYYDPRFWLPVLPVVAILFFTAVDDLLRRWPDARYPLRGYLLGFALLGIMALLFSTRISLAGREFGEYYGDGTARMTYRLALQNGREVDLSQVDEAQVQLLRIFEPLARTSRRDE